MRGWARALVWVVILLACAAVGAFVASRSNPFPPGVRDPGAQPSQTPSPSTPEAVPWSLTMSSRTRHTYRVGGSCTSDWHVKGLLWVTGSGEVRGRGTARLLPGARCDFPSAQVQARRVVVRIAGRRDGDELVLRFEEVRRRPVGSQDLGAFLETLPRLRSSIPERAGSEATERERFEDPQDEIQASVTTVRLGSSG